MWKSCLSLKESLNVWKCTIVEKWSEKPFNVLTLDGNFYRFLICNVKLEKCTEKGETMRNCVCHGGFKEGSEQVAEEQAEVMTNSVVAGIKSVYI